MIKTHAKQKIYSFFPLHKSYKVFYQGKPAVYGTALERKLGFITENLIKYRIQCRHYGRTCVSVGEGGAIREDLPPYFGRF